MPFPVFARVKLCTSKPFHYVRKKAVWTHVGWNCCLSFLTSFLEIILIFFNTSSKLLKRNDTVLYLAGITPRRFGEIQERKFSWGFFNVNKEMIAHFFCLISIMVWFQDPWNCLQDTETFEVTWQINRLVNLFKWVTTIFTKKQHYIFLFKWSFIKVFIIALQNERVQISLLHNLKNSRLITESSLPSKLHLRWWPIFSGYCLIYFIVDSYKEFTFNCL